MIANFFTDVFQLLQALFVTIPTDNVLGSLYVVLNLVLQIVVGFLGGDVNVPGFGF